mgnify:CR=1 FL=1
MIRFWWFFFFFYFHVNFSNVIIMMLILTRRKDFSLGSMVRNRDLRMNTCNFFHPLFVWRHFRSDLPNTCIQVPGNLILIFLNFCFPLRRRLSTSPQSTLSMSLTWKKKKEKKKKNLSVFCFWRERFVRFDFMTSSSSSSSI